nr:hypothetical protein [Microbacterium bovistercoris]
MPAAAEVIVFPDPIDLACAAINTTVASALAGAKATGRVPSTRPKRFIRVRRVGGVKETLISRQVTLTIEGYGQTETDAGRLCELGTAALYAQNDVLFGCFEIAAPAELPDPTTDQSRVTATVGVRVRGSVLA